MACADKAHQVDSEAGHPPRLLCIYLSIYLYLGASFVGRPICVCAVLAPLRRVNKDIVCALVSNTRTSSS